MDKGMIFDIIDSIAEQAKFIIGARIQQQELAEALKQSAKDWDKVGDETRKAFKALEDDVRAYFGKHCTDITPGFDYAEDGGCAEDGGEYCVGDEVYFIGDGCAVKDRIVSVMVETENGSCIDIDDIFHSMDELVERLKEDVDG